VLPEPWTTVVCVTVVVTPPAPPPPPAPPALVVQVVVTVVFWYKTELDDEHGDELLDAALDVVVPPVLGAELEVVLLLKLDLPPVELFLPLVVVVVLVVLEVVGLATEVGQGRYTTSVVVAQPVWQHGASTVVEDRGRYGTQEHGTVAETTSMQSATMQAD